MDTFPSNGPTEGQTSPGAPQPLTAQGGPRAGSTSTALHPGGERGRQAGAEPSACPGGCPLALGGTGPVSSLEASALPVPAQAGLPRPLWVTRGRGPSSTGSQGPRAVGRWPGDRAVHLRDPGWRRQTHLPVQGPLVQLISGSNPAAGLGGLLPGFEGKLRRQDASQLLQGEDFLLRFEVHQLSFGRCSFPE